MSPITAGRKASTGLVSMALSLGGMVAPAWHTGETRPDAPIASEPIADLAQLLAPFPMLFGLLGLVTALAPVGQDEEEAGIPFGDPDEHDPLGEAEMFP